MKLSFTAAGDVLLLTKLREIVIRNIRCKGWPSMASGGTNPKIGDPREETLWDPNWGASCKEWDLSTARPPGQTRLQKVVPDSSISAA